MQHAVLEMMALQNTTKDILARLCTLAESLLPNSVASIMLLDNKTGLMSIISAPSVPKLGHDALSHLKPGPGGGSCGNAVYKNEPQFIQDAFQDNRWSDLRQIAYDFNLCSCWSMPVRNKEKKAIGTFALSSFEHRSPALFHKKLLENAASLVNIVLKNEENEKRIQLFSSAMQNASEGMIITDANNKIIEVNQAFLKIYGYQEKDLLNQNPKIFSSGLYGTDFYTRMWQSISHDFKWSGEIVNKHADGSEIIQWLSISALYNEDNSSNNYLAIFSDLTELKNTQQQIKFMAYHDSLTGLHNKSYLEKLFSLKKTYTLILLNVNNFSYINTAYGYEIGDKLLILLANILKNNFNIDNTCRINSDEFALLYGKKISIKEEVAKIQSYFYTHEVQVDNITLNISFSYGGACGNKNLLRNSALALKQAKENGKNNLYIFNQDHDNIDHLQRELFIESNNLLHNALSENKLIPYFQGIMNNKTKKILKFEVLARIEKDGEIISPNKFIEPARLSGLLPEITKVMIDKSFKIMQMNTFIFSINITEDDLSRNYLVDYLKQKSLEYNINPNRVILEILEGVSATGKKNHTRQLNTLKEKGYALAIDDFGSEYSNFERILNLDINFLKIDSKYIKDIDTNPKSYEIAQAIVFFAKNAKIPCIAEFVHNKSVQKIVKKLKIDFSQGYYFSEPNPLPIA
ncbi:EAL domain-containing protein [bacterium]|nr:EAL domain-containing protein [bacterium]MBU1994052.1 EAL domain-containing protein [bacterium]